jgi:hypothetical protein
VDSDRDRRLGAKPSLFIVALPRSLTSLVYHAARGAVALRQPEWTTDGEILNVRRFALLAEEGTVEGVRYVERERDGERFDRLLAFLGQVACAEGFAYKDVIQPYVVAEWLAARPVRVLYIERPVPDVAYAMLERGWHYPARPDGPEPGQPYPGSDPDSEAEADLERRLVAGLLRARGALAAVADQWVHYDELIHDETPLWDALRSLYGAEVRRPHYLDEDFSGVREKILGRRATERYRRLVALCDDPVAAELRGIDRTGSISRLAPYRGAE